MPLYKSPFVVLALTLWCARLPAQSPSRNGGDQTNRISTVVSFYTWPVRGILHGDMQMPGLPPVALTGDSRAEMVHLQRGGLSPAYRYQGPRPMVLSEVRSVTTNEVTGSRSPTLVPLSRIEIPETWPQAIVVLFPETRLGDGTWSNIPLRASELDIPKGKSRFYNTSDRVVAVEVDGKTARIEPQGQVLLDPGLLGKDDRIRIRLYSLDHRGEARLIYTSSHWRHETKGNLYVIYARDEKRLRVLQLSPDSLESP